MIKILFFGTSDFAVPVLERLAEDARFDVKLVVTQPDKPVGRHATLTPPAVKVAAEKLNLTVAQFTDLKSPEVAVFLKEVDADVAVVVSYGNIIPQEVLDLPKHGMVNVHASLLPKYRGASPIAAAIANGDAETGVTLMVLDAEMDHGPTLASATEPIKPDDTTPTLSARLADVGARILPDVLEKYVSGELIGKAQEHEKATFVKLLTREDGKLDPKAQTAAHMERLIRAYTPWPGTYVDVDGKRLKILSASSVAPSVIASPPSSVISNGVRNLPPGSRTIVSASPALVCFDGSVLVLTRVQPEGKPEMDGKDFLRGSKTWTKE